MYVYYHVTPKRNLRAIAERGLLPKRGTRSRALGEVSEAVYLFADAESLETAGGNWLLDEFSEGALLAVLAVRLPQPLTAVRGQEFEVTSTEIVGPGALTLLTSDWGNETSYEFLRAPGVPLADACKGLPPRRCARP